MTDWCSPFLDRDMHLSGDGYRSISSDCDFFRHTILLSCDFLCLKNHLVIHPTNSEFCWIKLFISFNFGISSVFSNNSFIPSPPSASLIMTFQTKARLCPQESSSCFLHRAIRRWCNYGLAFVVILIERGFSQSFFNNISTLYT